MSIIRKKEPLTTLNQNEFERTKFKARIAFIDDEEVEHIERLRKEGYNITQYSDSELENIDDFIRKEYHVVILDIQGVGKHISPIKEGWGILKYLKDECPHIVVIMYTGADWSITKYKNLADKADDFIGKDLEFLDFKAKLNNGVRKAFSIDYHFDIEKQKLISKLKDTNSINDVKRIIENYGANETKTKKLLRKYIKDNETLNVVSSLLGILGGINKLITGI